MKYIQVVWSLTNLLFGIASSPQFKVVVDSMLDPIEEAFKDERGVIKACNTIRKMLDVPDNDDDEPVGNVGNGEDDNNRRFFP